MVCGSVLTCKPIWISFGFILFSMEASCQLFTWGRTTCGCYVIYACMAPIRRGATLFNSIFIHGFHLNFYLPCCLHTAGPGCYQRLPFLFQRLIIVVIVAVDDWHSHRVFTFIVRKKPWPGGLMVVMVVVGGVHAIPRRWNARCASTIFWEFLYFSLWTRIQQK